jgi:hypothetical protein
VYTKGFLLPFIKLNYPISTMNRTLLMAGFCVFITINHLPAQTNQLNWASSFSPPWANGLLHRQANNIGGNNLDCDANISMHGGGFFTLTMGTYGVLSPSVAGAVFTVPGSPERIQLTPDFNNKNAYSRITMEFSTPVSYVSFKIADIDKALPTSTTYFDRVTITGKYNNTDYFPTITKYDPATDPGFLVISGNSAYVNTTPGEAGNADSDASDQRGTITVDFGGTFLTSITIEYDNAPGVDNNPATQSIAIGSVSFFQSPLPVTLSDFNGHRDVADVILNWTTSQELKSAAFEIERSTEGALWEKIGTVQAAGNSSSPIDYSFTDRSPTGSILLYRLKQIDIDAHFKYSGVVRINTLATVNDLQLYPNPVKDKVSVGIYSGVQQAVHISLIDPIGQTVRTETRNLYSGANNILINGLNYLPRSTYQLIIHDTEGNLLGRAQLMKQ